ncbi:MAG: hypothetical protein K6A38_10265 [Lachnospiraceae bacterium]|nr:hypothetical protein [Lachnospiraceae bacterium]
MKYPIFASVVAFSLWLMFAIHRKREKEAEEYQAFWDEEAKANATRRKPLDDLNYITIPFDKLPVDVLSDREEIASCLEMLHTLSEAPIVNFTGLTNTELKLRYGAPNIDTLSNYDQSYTLLVRTLDKWAHLLYKEGKVKEAKTILEFSVETGSDVSSTYDLLADIYLSDHENEKIKELIPKAEGLNSLMKKSIIKNLEDHLEKA